MKRKHVVLIFALISYTAFGVSILSYPPVSKIVADQFGLSNAQSGFITSAFFLSYLSMQIPGGFLADKYGAAKMVLIGTFAMAGTPLIFVVGDNFTAAIISRVIGGIAGGLVFPAEIRLLSFWFRKQKDLDQAMGYFGTGSGLGQIIAAWVLPVLILGADWRPPLLFAAAFSFASGMLIILVLRWTNDEKRILEIANGTGKQKEFRVDIRGLFTRNMFALMLPNFASVAVMYGVFTWSAQFLNLTFGSSLSLAGSIVALIGVSAIVGSYAGPIFDKRIGMRPTLALSMILCVVFTVLLGFSFSPIVAATWIFGIGFASSLYFAADFSLIPYASRQGVAAAGMTFGVFNTLSNLGTFLAPVLFGFILDITHENFQIGYISIAIIAISGLVGAVLVQVDTSSISA